MVRYSNIIVIDNENVLKEYAKMHPEIWDKLSNVYEKEDIDKLLEKLNSIEK
jgi:L-rhamnose mutarotase